MNLEITWISDNDSLRDHCDEWCKWPFIAMDTEFIRETTFFVRPGLLQLSNGNSTFLLDPLTITDWQPFAMLMESPDVVKVFHASGEDLEVIQQLTGVYPLPLFDTQLAAAFLNMDYSMGYSRLVKECLDVVISKQETRSDWLQRPLSRTQEQYAALDVVYLAQLYSKLSTRLSSQKLKWLYEDTQELVRTHQQPAEFDALYKTSGYAWRLSGVRLAVFRSLYAWREQQARQQNKPRGHILKEAALQELARIMPDSIAAVAGVSEIYPSTVRRYGDVLLKLIREAKSLPPDKWPESLPGPLPSESSNLRKKLKKSVHEVAVRHGLAPELLWRKKIMEDLLRSGYSGSVDRLPPSLQGWRRVLMEEELTNVLIKRKDK